MRKDGERGSVMVLSALALAVIVVFGAAAVNIAHQSQTKRQLHTIADLSAQDGTFALGSPTADRDAATAAVASARRNGFVRAIDGGPTGNTLTVTVGRWDFAAQRFTPAEPDEIASATAVMVAATTTYTDDILTGGRDLSATAVAQAVGPPCPAGTPPCPPPCPPPCGGSQTWEMSGVEVGSFAARADVQNSLLGPMFGLSGAETVTAAGYSGLADASVTLDQLAAAANAGSVSQLMAASLTFPQLINFAAQAYDPTGSSSADAAVALRQLGVDAGASRAVQAQQQFQLSTLVALANSTAGASLSSGYGSAASGHTALNLLSLVTAAPEVALADSHHVVSATLPASVNLPPLGGVTVTLSTQMIESPQAAYGLAGDAAPPAAQASTAQLRAQLTIAGTIAVRPLGALLPTLVSVNLPIVLEGFGGTGRLSAIDCSTGAVDITAQPTAGKVGIGTDGDLGTPLGGSLPSAPLISIAGIPVLSGSVVTAIGQPAATRLHFASPPDAWSPTMRPPARGPHTVGSLNVGPALSTALEGAGSNLTFLGGAIGLSDLLNQALNPALAGLDSVLGPINQGLGIAVAGLDVWNTARLGAPAAGPQCVTSTLVH